MSAPAESPCLRPPPAPRAPIRVLSPATVNRIAAGEVIERPAAAVKELVENALDAGAARIGVEIEGGGIDRIAVSDDGCGMDAAGLALAIERHATSKLADADDLAAIATLGFRGEALPAIGAAARLAIVSRPRGAESGHAISVAGGVVGPVRPQAGPPGTLVEVRDLFHATPARRKFLKSPRVEAEHAEAAVRRLAFAAPGVALRLAVDGRTLFDLPAQDRAARTASLLGAATAAGLVPVAASRGAMQLAGYAALPSASRTSPAAQSLVVNGRPVADPLLRTAVRIAYRDVLAPGRHPVVALWLDLPPEALDVNVHPAKTELRFAEPDAVRGLLIGALQRALAVGAGAAGGVTPDADPGLALPGRWTKASWPARPRPPLALVAPAPAAAGLAEAQLPLEAPPGARLLDPPAAEAGAYPLGAAVAQVLDTYVLALAADGALVLVDQHAAHERLTHEALREQLLAGEVLAQPLLLPAVVELSAADAARLLAQAAALARLGVLLEPFGPGAVLVRALPALLGAPDPAPLLRDLADELAECGEAVSLQARLDAALARLACHGSIRAGRRLGRAEMDALLRRMEATPRAATCSHGRPTYLRLTRAGIEALFGRS